MVYWKRPKIISPLQPDVSHIVSPGGGRPKIISPLLPDVSHIVSQSGGHPPEHLPNRVLRRRSSPSSSPPTVDVSHIISQSGGHPPEHLTNRVLRRRSSPCSSPPSAGVPASLSTIVVPSGERLRIISSHGRLPQRCVSPTSSRALAATPAKRLLLAPPRPRESLKSRASIYL